MRSSKDILSRGVLVLLAIALYFSVQFNSFNVAQQAIHDNYQRESESLVLSDLYAEGNNIPTLGWRLGYIAPEATGVPDILYPYNNFGTNQHSDVKFIPYVSQYGIQSFLFKELGGLFGVNDINGLKNINSILFVITIFLLATIYARLFNYLFAVVFCLSLVFSPWIVPIARNLYWVPFTWFLPAVFSGFYFLTKNKSVKCLMLLMVFITFALKCMAGYEYITSITLLTAAPAFLSPLFNKEHQGYKVKDFILIFLACVLAFVVVLLMHASMRGDGVMNGLHNIYEYDVKRRTYGDASNFANVEIQKSLNVTPLYVLHIYLAEWSTEVLKFVSGRMFPWLLGLLLLGCIFARDKKIWIPVIYALSIPLSWYILAKGHSEVHVFINFVLWYLLFIPVMFYVFIDSVYKMILKVKS